MATKAYILIKTSAGKLRSVTSTLRSVPAMESVDTVTGPYDIIAVMTASDLNMIGELIPSRIHTIRGIDRTLTCIVIESSGEF